MNVHKSKGWTSHDVVARVRRVASQKRVGHAGTLDPMAEGVLPVLLGRATRLADYIQQGQKTYLAVVRLGTATDTDDAEGSVVASMPVPVLSAEQLRETLAPFTGEIMQRPPSYSALKIAGQRAYAVARRGEAVELAPRPVVVHALRLVARSTDELTLEVTCSKGTYIRALARDLAECLGTVGHLRSLVRTRVGHFTLDDAVPLDRLAEQGIGPSLQSPRRALPDAHEYGATPDEVARLTNGQAIPCAVLRAESLWVYDPDGRVVCLASADRNLLHPRLLL